MLGRTQKNRSRIGIEIDNDGRCEQEEHRKQKEADKENIEIDSMDIN